MPHKNILVATIVIMRKDRILLLRRSKANTHFAGQWQLPEGKIEVGESAEDAIRREVKEELSYIFLAKPRHIGIVQTEGTIDKKRIVVKRTVFFVELHFDITLSPEHDTYQWTERTKVASLTLSPGTLDVIKLIL